MTGQFERNTHFVNHYKALGKTFGMIQIGIQYHEAKIRLYTDCSKLNLGLCPSDPKRFEQVRRDVRLAIVFRTLNIEHRTSNIE